MSYGNSWAYGLIEAIKDSSKIIFRSETLVCIKDLYPKARHHFLIIPEERTDIDNIYDLRKEDIEIIQEMLLMGINSIELVGNKIENFRMGFHIQPSMKR
jgi:aprataxin